MRMCAAHGQPGIELFVYGRSGGPFPARQHEQASRAVARGHGLDPASVLFIEQAPAAIAAGAFHNDVVAVANETVLFCHEQAFADPAGTYEAIRRLLPEAQIIEVPASMVSLGDAVKSYLFNAQLVTLPSGGMALIVPAEAREVPAVSRYLDALVTGNGPIRQVLPVSVRQSMANGGGPACASESWPIPLPSTPASCWMRLGRRSSAMSSPITGPKPSIRPSLASSI